MKCVLTSHSCQGMLDQPSCAHILHPRLHTDCRISVDSLWLASAARDVHIMHRQTENPYLTVWQWWATPRYTPHYCRHTNGVCDATAPWVVSRPHQRLRPLGSDSSLGRKGTNKWHVKLSANCHACGKRCTSRHTVLTTLKQ